MKMFKGFSVDKVKDFLATNRLAQIVIVFTAIVLVWLAYIYISSLLSTLRSQSLLEAMAHTLSTEYQEIELNASLDSQTTGLTLAGSLYRQGSSDIAAEGTISMAQVDLETAKLDLGFSSSEDGQFIHVGDVDSVIDTISAHSPASSGDLEALSEEISNTWIKVSEVDDRCYQSIIQAVGDEDSELREVMMAAYIKNPLIKVHNIVTLQDDGREYHISPISSNMKAFAREIKNSKAINRLDDCSGGISYIDNMATTSQEEVNQLLQAEAANPGPSLVITVKDEAMTQISTSSTSEDTTFSLSAVFKDDEEGRELARPDVENAGEISDYQEELQVLVENAQEYAAQQQETQPQGMPPMGM